MAWLTNWNYRKAITITNTESALTDYQISITTDTLTPYNAGKMRLDCGDIRFTDTDGSALLNYWIESGINTISTKIWIKVPSILSDTKTIYLYYGSPIATYNNAQGLANTFIREISGVVGAWSFDGNALDTSGNANNGILYGGMGYTAGKFGQAASFDGVDDYVNCGNDASLDPTNITVSVWVNVSSFAQVGGFDQRILTKQIDANNRYVMSTSSTDSTFTFFYLAGDVNHGFKSNTGKSTFTWYHLVGTWDGTNLKVFVNGMDDTSTNTNFPSGGTSNLVIGQRGGNNGWFNGIIDEIRIYNHALSTDEVSDLYNNYGYVTTNYPNKELVRKYISPEPTFYISVIEETPANIISTDTTVSRSTPCVEGTCIVTANVTWTNTGTGSGDFVPNIKIDGIIQTPVYPLQSLAPTESVTKSFTITGLSIGIHTICPDPN